MEKLTITGLTIVAADVERVSELVAGGFTSGTFPSIRGGDVNWRIERCQPFRVSAFQGGTRIAEAEVLTEKQAKHWARMISSNRVMTSKDLPEEFDRPISFMLENRIRGKTEQIDPAEIYRDGLDEFIQATAETE